MSALDGLEPAERRRIAHIRLDELLDHFVLFDGAEGEERRRWARVLVSQTASFCSFLCGSDMTAVAYGPVTAIGDRAAALNALSSRLHVASMIFGRLENSSVPGSLIAAAQDAVAVARGDEPQMFAKVSRYKVNYRLALARLRALEWDAYLDGRGVPSYERQAAISTAYTNNWDTIRKWSERARAALGDKQVDEAIRIAKLMAVNELAFWGMACSDDWQSALRDDGEAFRAASIANKTVSG